MHKRRPCRFIRYIGCMVLLAGSVLNAAVKPSPVGLEAGFAQIDITPPVGTLMTGAGLVPAVGTDDPLRASAMVLRNGKSMLAVVGVDLVKLRRDIVEAAVSEASKRTGIDPDAILICASHTHSSPFIPRGGSKNGKYLAALPHRIAMSVERAYRALVPARMFIGRSLVNGGLHNRRLISKKDGKVINTWMPKRLNDLQETPQLLGAEGPIDPEMWAVRFSGPGGRVLGVLVNFTCVPSFHDRNRLRTWSADYPGLIAERMRRAFGKQVVTVFTLGAAGNISPNKSFTPKWKKHAEIFARAAVGAAGPRAIPVKEPIAVASIRRNVRVPRRIPNDRDRKEIARLGWREKTFEKEINRVDRMPRTLEIPVSAARIGPIGMATNAGELFVEWGLSIKKRSPFPYTFVSEMTNDSQGYEPTAKGFEDGGYESLVGVNVISLEGIRTLVDTAVELLNELWKNPDPVK